MEKLVLTDSIVCYANSDAYPYGGKGRTALDMAKNERF